MMRNFGEMLERLKNLPPVRLIVVQAADAPVLEAVKDAYEKGIIEPVLVGEKEKIQEEASKIGFSLENIEIIDCPAPEAPMVGVRLVYENQADVLMKGLVDTAAFMRAVLNPDFGLRTGMLLSHLAAFEIPNFDRILFITDGGVNIAPTLEEKAAILQNAVNALRAIGYSEPKVALLSAVETVSAKMQSAVDAAILAKMAERKQIRGALVDGPLALDNAVSEEAAAHKGIKSPVAGKADLILVPNIETGNALGKSLTFLAGGNMAGIVVGAKAPVVLSSRADSPVSKLMSIAFACLVKRGEKL
ncbi:phosphate butyryltransferase [Thermosediminibacter litoriperuensis]|uniref:Phosphate butyryltransferase n=2 Tax=Thermosediminibacter litoriperuensis TaxID=291989 RepID=A0A5S5AYM1_9FIRM|nr:bifunctional enoyl-CoA hydratase/phosphate acetyltransferase [Thermosediminibacter litoriperuensis]TYP58571.1 phosphate butyryltransferase [Thermosediminibacter litoriperuensis]